ncbi:MerR family transcriptional regulator [Pseudonocardia acaciae]|uniref:MerR family transcriptional regulator n=1 Tax=Pseudonocardia acaciae TaxID=551276 RepID=UPI0006873389|nr:MerR family transcriptional regulator [Pseudonocardia acaciae]
MTAEADGERFTIGELAALAGMRPSALRYYEDEGLLAPAGRSGQQRVFDRRGVHQLAAIDFWREAGFTLDEMSRLFHDAAGSISEAKRVAADRVAELERFIEEAGRVKDLLHHVLSCENERLDECPHYQEHLHERAERIVSGDYRRDRRLRLQPLRRSP